MSPKTKRIILFVVSILSVIALSPRRSLAQDTSFDEDENTLPQKGHPGFFAAGSFYLQTFSPDLTPFNDKITEMGIGKLNPIIVQYGVNAFGSVQKKWRIGLFYYAGNSSTSGTTYDSVYGFRGVYGFDKTAKVSVKGGGISTGYRITLPKSFELEPSLWLGMTFIDVELSQTDSRVDWNEVWFGYRDYAGTIQETISSYYVFAQPGIIVRYYPRSWVAVGLGAQYIVPITKANSWTLAGYKVRNAPTFDPSSVSTMLIVSFGI